MTFIYRFVADRGYFRAALRHIDSQRPDHARQRLILTASLVGIGLFATAYIGSFFANPPWDKAIVVGLQFGVLFGLLPGFVRFLTQGTRVSQLRRAHSAFGRNVTVALNSTGLSDSEAPHKQMPWSSITHCTRFSDGILVFAEAGTHWLPDSALVDAQPSDVENFVQTHSRLEHAV
jgi:hypothetical protein